MNTLRLKYLFTLLICTLTLAAFAQTGRIGGKIVDQKTGEELIGVSVQIEGTSMGAASDFEGKYTINGVQPGTYNLVLSYISYNKKVIKGVEVKAKELTTLNASMEESSKDLAEVVIQAEFKKESANALLVQQKNATSVSSGVSADLIRKTPDRTTADVLKRISGASIQDNKFAVVRGLSDRYNMGFLNGAPLPSTESDRKAFSLDIIPASVIDNMQIIKGGTPDMPGDFAGGIIQINTKDIPEENTFSVQFGGQYHSLTTFQSGLRSDGSSTDWMAYDNGARAIPTAVLSTDANRNALTSQEVNQSKLFNNNYAPVQVNSFRPNISFQMAASRRMKLFKNDLGAVVALNYSNSLRSTPFTTVDPVGIDEVSSFDTSKAEGRFMNNETYRNNVSVGGIFNLSYKIGKSSKFSFKNLFTMNSEDQVTQRTGINYVAGLGRDQQILSNDYIYYYQSGKMLSSQFNGEHLLSALKVKIKYTGAYTNIHREIPDYKRLLYTSTKQFATDTFPAMQAVIASNAGSFDPNQSGRFFSVLDEKMYSGGYDITVPLKVSGFKKFEVKAGGMHTRRTRDFNARSFIHSQNDNTYDPSKGDSLKYLAPGQIFNSQNIDSTTSYLTESTQGSDQYAASSALNAGFAMVDFKVLAKLRVITGVRIESFNQQISSQSQGAQRKVDTTVVDWLPSINTIYELTEKINIRAGYAKTVSRPEFREFAQLAFYDVNTNATITGNPNLVRTQIHNFDLKFEYFPTAAQTFSINPFYKRFVSPIENELRTGTGRNFSYRNGSAAESFGIEFEARFNLGFIAKENKILNNFFVFANYALIQSKVELDVVQNTGAKDIVTNRPLQGQSPYVFNSGIQYIDAIRKFDVSLTCNQVGDRIAYVANTNKYLVWEQSRLVIDASVSKTFFKKLMTKITLGDILAQPLVFYQDLNANGKYDKGADVDFAKYKFGYTVQLSVGYTF